MFFPQICVVRELNNLENFQQTFCKESVMKSFIQSNDYKTACVLIIFHENG